MGVAIAGQQQQARSGAHIVAIDLERLFRLRAAVGRFGEMDAAGWWNTRELLGVRGAAVYKRGLPETHFLARVRVVTAVAAERSRTVYPATGVATLWSLPPALERSLSFQERTWATNGSRDEWTEFAAALGSYAETFPVRVVTAVATFPRSRSHVARTPFQHRSGAPPPGPACMQLQATVRLQSYRYATVTSAERPLTIAGDSYIRSTRGYYHP
jgi:hypothetical protein